MFVHLLPFFIAFLHLADPIGDCGDGVTYAAAEQTANDPRFAEYPKIDSSPKFKGGRKKLDRWIKNRLELSDAAKKEIFNLNYRLTVGCDGSLRDIQYMGDPKGASFTNIVAILFETAGQWTPAEHNGVPVDCIYYGTFFVYGDEYDY